MAPESCSDLPGDMMALGCSGGNPVGDVSDGCPGACCCCSPACCSGSDTVSPAAGCCCCCSCSVAADLSPCRRRQGDAVYNRDEEKQGKFRQKGKICRGQLRSSANVSRMAFVHIITSYKSYSVLLFCRVCKHVPHSVLTFKHCICVLTKSKRLVSRFFVRRSSKRCLPYITRHKFPIKRFLILGKGH